ncbi:putative ABC transporter ATP-binding protein [Gordonia hirsuta DSM 44140 = NBRC 16056]|uniref:Putative ABC transporter ATP-binding protein n=1 Tax=Gordonia hirsuta DSM 44140 = NBRC 16056 TaxID=1121927 RepID=L7LA73_9ACTN|nr:ATP-binding cassette domain-containing protein [Gordonia hirsuta]GAC56952.1 putative ABC transporter ATP-binding protein [Gordonia hirsuta DSM 44140 = NBRC 16056]
MSRIQVRDLRIELSGRTILHDVDLSAEPGELIYLLGRNGAGKSTLLRSICGMITPASGEVLIDGTPVRRLPSPARSLGMHLGTEPVHPGHTARRHLRWIAAAAGVGGDRIDQVLARTGVDAYGNRRIGDYSLGMRQRLGIATALLPVLDGGDGAGALVFDEPLNGLDVEGIVWLRNLLGALAADGHAVLVASHLLAEVARSADRIVLIDRQTASPAVPVAEFQGRHDDLESAYLAAIGVRADSSQVPG